MLTVAHNGHGSITYPLMEKVLDDYDKVGIDEKVEGILLCQ